MAATGLDANWLAVGWLPIGWLGAALLLAAGYGWGRQLREEGLTGPALAAALLLTVSGLALTAQAALAGHDLPLLLGGLGALGASALAVFRAEGP